MLGKLTLFYVAICVHQPTFELSIQRRERGSPWSLNLIDLIKEEDPAVSNNITRAPEIQHVYRAAI